MAFEDWKTDTFKKVDVRGVQGNFSVLCDWREELTVSAMNSIPKST